MPFDLFPVQRVFPSDTGSHGICRRDHHLHFFPESGASHFRRIKKHVPRSPVQSEGFAAGSTDTAADRRDPDLPDGLLLRSVFIFIGADHLNIPEFDSQDRKKQKDKKQQQGNAQPHILFFLKIFDLFLI